MKNKSGWIEIVEAFVAVLLIAGVVLIVLNKGYFQKTDLSDQVYESQLSILREIETTDSFRSEILSIADASLPVGSDNNSIFPADIKAKIIARTPNSLNCFGEICNLNVTCSYSGNTDKNIYSQSVIISSTLQQGAVYRQMDLFCWTK